MLNAGTDAADPRLRCVSPAELMLVVATGGSMDPYYMPRVIEFITNLTQSLPVDEGQVRVGVMTYGAQPSIDIALGAYSSAAELTAAAANITYHGIRYLLLVICRFAKFHFRLSSSAFHDLLLPILLSGGPTSLRT